MIMYESNAKMNKYPSANLLGGTLGGHIQLPKLMYRN